MIYLDNAATTRPFPAVTDTVARCLSEHYFNPSSAYAPAMESAALIKEVRKEVLAAFGAKNARCIFTSGATESNNTAIFGSLRGPSRILTTQGEHPSVLSLQAEAERRGHSFVPLPLESNGLLRMDALESALREGAALLSVQWVNNETGAVQPLEAIRRLRDAHCPEALLHVDSVQGFLRLPLSFSGIDLLSLSGHKVHAPKGIGALLLSERVRLRPLLYGGGQEESLRSGTENTPGIAGLGEALRHFARHPEWPGDLRAMKSALLLCLRESLPELLLNGPDPDSAAPHILNISLPGLRGEVLLRALEARGVLAATGSACSTHKKGSHVLRAMSLSRDAQDGALRLSISPQNTPEEMREAACVLIDCARELYPFRRK